MGGAPDIHHSLQFNLLRPIMGSLLENVDTLVHIEGHDMSVSRDRVSSTVAFIRTFPTVPWASRFTILQGLAILGGLRQLEEY